MNNIAVRYANPIFELAKQNQILEIVKNDMDTFIALCKVNRELSLMLKSPIIPHLKKSEILSVLFKDKFSDLVVKAIDLITRKKREYILIDIAKAFVDLYNQSKGLCKVVLTTGYEIDEELEDSFKILAKKINTKDPILQKKINPSIIGGYILKFNDQQIDHSISRKLKDLKLKFSNK